MSTMAQAVPLRDTSDEESAMSTMGWTEKAIDELAAEYTDRMTPVAVTGDILPGTRLARFEEAWALVESLQVPERRLTPAQHATIALLLAGIIGPEDPPPLG